MRRVAYALLAGGALLSGAADCGTAPVRPPARPPASVDPPALWREGFPVAPDERCPRQGERGRMSTGVELDCRRAPDGALRWHRS